MLSATQKQDLLRRLKCGHIRSVVNDIQVYFETVFLVVVVCLPLYAKNVVGIASLRFCNICNRLQSVNWNSGMIVF